VSRIAGVAPELTTAVLHLAQSLLLPTADGDTEAVPGGRVRSALPEPVFGALTSLGRAAARRFNELGPADSPRAADLP
jgi:hypothetical protein